MKHRFHGFFISIPAKFVVHDKLDPSLQLKPVLMPFGCTLSYTSPISAISAVFGYKFQGIPNLYYL